MDKDSVYTVPDPHVHDIILDSLWSNLALKSTTILQNLITANHRKNGESKYDRKPAEIDVVTTLIRYRVNGVKDISKTFTKSITIQLLK